MDIFQNPTKKLPKKDSQIVRVSMEQSEIGGRKDHMPADEKSGDLAIRHVNTGKS